MFMAVFMVVEHDMNPTFEQPSVAELIFYDAPTPPAGLFDDFLAITPITKDISTRSFKSLVQSSGTNTTALR